MSATGVVVVGAGPVGLALACELAWRAIPVTVIDQTDGSVTFPAGEAIFSRTMEHLRRWGVSAQAREQSAPSPDYPHRIVFMTQVVGHLIAEFDSGATNRRSSEYAALTPEAPAFFSKFSFLPTLRATALRLGATVRYGERVISAAADDTGVATTVRAADGSTRKLRSSYLVSCEGGGSSIRQALGITMEGSFAQGQNFAVHFRAPALLELLRSHAAGLAAQIQTMTSPRRPYITVVNGVDEWRLSAYIDHEPARDEAMTLIRMAIGADIDVEILAAQPWSGHRVVAQSYRAGRVFLAGDAAHLLWPKGGFGANTGIGDAIDLGWKLAGVLQGWGGPGLLDSYEAERRPIAVRNVDHAAGNWLADTELASGPSLSVPGPGGDAARNQARADVIRLRAREYRTAGVQLGHRYRNSPICIPDGSPEPPDDPGHYSPTTWPGARAPHAWLPDGTSTLDHFGRGFTLVARAGVDVGPLMAAAGQAGIPLEVLRVDGEIATRYERPLVLVRPDGHVSWRATKTPPDLAALFARVCGALGTATTTQASALLGPAGLAAS